MLCQPTLGKTTSLGTSGLREVDPGSCVSRSRFAPFGCYRLCLRARPGTFLFLFKASHSDLEKVRKVENLWARMFRGVLAKEMVLELGVTVTLQFTEHFMTGVSNRKLRYPTIFVLEMPLALKNIFSRVQKELPKHKNGVTFSWTIPYQSHSCNYLLLSQSTYSV